VKKLAVPPGSRAAPICIVSIDQRYEGQGKAVGMAILGTERGRQIKTVIVVDSDVDPENWNDVEWALATRMQPHRDVLIIPGAAGGDAHFDPSLSPEDRAVGRSSKMIIDATKFNARDYPTPCVPKSDVLEEVERNWSSYGIERR
jgi:4-hydroxy-3-polyprenylbenzoate decarboxylase